MTNTKTKERQARRTEAIVTYFDERYGEDGPTLEAWQKFCRDVGVAEGSSITQCKKGLRNVHINIVDFVHAMKNGQAVSHFESRGALAKYITANMSQKCFPLVKAKKDSFLKTLLIHLDLSRYSKK